jgi:hypothetical protein
MTNAYRIPADQVRALDRRHMLDDQQRAFRAPVSRPHFPSRRPG